MSEMNQKGGRKRGVQVPPTAAETWSSAAVLESTAPAQEPPATAMPARAWQTLIPCLLSAIICSVLLIILLKLYSVDPRIPIEYVDDSLTFLSKAKGILQG